MRVDQLLWLNHIRGVVMQRDDKDQYNSTEGDRTRTKNTSRLPPIRVVQPGGNR